MAKSQRLTNHIRDKIVNLLVKDKESTAKNNEKLLHQRLFDTIYHELYTFEDITKMSGLPDGWLPTTNYLKMKINGDVVGGSSDTAVRIPNKQETWGVQLIAEDCLPKATLKSLVKNIRDVNNERDANNQLRRDLYGTLSSITTDKKLKEQWPECYEKVKELFGEQEVVLLPSISMFSLNERLGLK